MNWLHCINEIAVSIVMGVLVFLFPYKPKEYIATWRKLELDVKYRYWDWRALPLLIIFIPAITWIFGRIFIFQYQFEKNTDPSILFQLLPEPEWWYTVALILAFGVVCYPILWIYRLQLKENYADYKLFINLKYGIDLNKSIKFGACFLGVLTLVAMHLLNNYYIKIRRSEIEANSLMDLEAKHYPFGDVKRLTYFKHVRSNRSTTGLMSSPHYEIEFKDGTVYNTQLGLHDVKTEPKAIAFLSSQSGTRVDTVNIDPKFK